MHKRKSGFGLLETLIAATIGALVLMGIMRVFKTTFDGQRRADTKNDVQSLETRIKNLIAEEATCTPSFIANLRSSTFDPADLPEYNDDVNKASAAVKLGSGELLGPGSTYGHFKLGALELKIIGPVGTAGLFEAALVMDFDTGDTVGRQLTGGKLNQRNVPVMLKTDAIPGSQPPMRKITGCYGKGGMSGREICQSLSGRWINSLDRCYFGGDLKLNQFECVDPAEFLAGGALEGASLETCFRRWGALRLEYKCWNDVKATWWPKCTCGRPGWQVTRPMDGYTWFNCDGGVMIKVPDEKTVFLKSNEFTDGKFAGAPPDGETATYVTTDRLTTDQLLEADDSAAGVVECYPNPANTKEIWRCQAERATLGQYASCIFVDGSRAWDGAHYLQNYTGWIWTGYGRGLLQLGAGNNAYTVVTEALGRKCFLVKKAAASASGMSARFSDTVDPGPAAVPNILTDETRFKDIKQCVFMGGDTSAGNDPAPASAWPYRGRYIQRFPCNNSNVDTGNLAGDTSTNPTLDLGTCWYFDDVVLPYRFAKSKGVTAGRKWSGWAYLLSNLPDEFYDTVSGTNHVKIQANKSPVLNAVPCNLGVRISID